MIRSRPSIHQSAYLLPPFPNPAATTTYFLNANVGSTFTFISRQPGVMIKIESASLIETLMPRDTISKGYFVKRVPAFDRVEYQIICSARKVKFDSKEAARLLSFYMLTGREFHN